MIILNKVTSDWYAFKIGYVKLFIYRTIWTLKSKLGSEILKYDNEEHWHFMNIALTRDKFIFGANPVKVKQTAAIQFSAHDKHERE